MIQNKTSAYISLKKRFILLVVPLLILVNFIFYQLYLNQKKTELFILEHTAKNQLDKQKEKIEKFSNNIFNDLQIILNHYEMLSFIDNEKNNPSKSLVHNLIQFAKFERIYDQIRYIDASGMEVIRINFNNGRPEPTPKESLQNKENRYYFKDTFRLNKNEIFMSPMDLNIENGEIEIPYKPMIRVGTPVFDQNDEKKGVLMVNYMSRRLLDSLSENIISPTSHIFLLNRNGYFLKGMTKEEEWGFMFPNKKPVTFETRFPDIWPMVKKDSHGMVTHKTGIFTFDTVCPLKMGVCSSDGAVKAFSPSRETLLAEQYHWKLVHFVSADDFFNGSLKGLKHSLVSLSGIISIIIIIITYFLSLFLDKKKSADVQLRIAHDNLEQKVTDRVKELDCLYELSRLSTGETQSINALLEKVIRIVPRGYRFPDITQCRINLDDTWIQSKDYRAGSFVLEAPLVTPPQTRGVIEVTCSRKQEQMDDGPLLKEGQALIDAIAKLVSSMISRTEHHLEKQKLEEQLHHSQKMEAIGQLSGGIAHDFNNLLTVINGFAELGKLSSKNVSDLAQHFDAIMEAGEKAAGLTRQLLVFSRKDAIQPKPLQVNSVIENAVKLLKRVVGEHIRQEICLDPHISKIMADQTQIDQLIFNLVINARDAINEKNENHKNLITITTRELTLDQDFTRVHFGIEPGLYVLIEICDTGIGMTREIQEKIFNPFFSTKSKKSGTGLGLATVYGIIRQNKGAVSVYSEKGIGTTFRIYWPVLKDKETAYIVEKSRSIVTDFNDAVVLVVEDDEHLNLFACNALKSKGISVLSAFDGEQALDLITQEENRVDLLFTDVVLPGMNGRELADEVLKSHPDIHVLYTSGYTERFFSEDGILPSDIHFLRKPYSIQDLFEKVGTALQFQQKI